MRFEHQVKVGTMAHDPEPCMILCDPSPWRDDRRCGNSASYLYGDLAVCHGHERRISGALSLMIQADPARVARSLVESDDDGVAAELVRLRARVAELEAEIARRNDSRERAVDEDLELREQRATCGTVYYAQRGGYVKIGVANDVPRRMIALERGGVIFPDGVSTGPVELLATEPGGQRVEHERHVQFADARVAGEWFRKSPDLMSHIESLPALVAA